MLSPESTEFYNSWRRKADERAQENTLAALFDAYFSHYVVFNRLYAEATFTLARTGAISIPRTSFPDAKGAKEYGLQLVTARRFLRGIEGDRESVAARAAIIELIDRGTFAIKLDMIHGTPQRGLDIDLLRDLRSGGCAQKSKAILDLLYSIRCNMFHGYKGFAPIQADLLRPAITLLRRCSEILFTKLNED